MTSTAYLTQRIQEIINAHFAVASAAAFKVGYADDAGFGDIATNVALVVAPLLGQAPRDVAEVIVRELEADDIIESVTVAGPGFINITLTDSYLIELLTGGTENAPVVDNTASPVIFEFGQPNTHKVPHIGHLFSYVRGESCVRLLASQGHHVKRANYQGDVGPHVAKCLWAYLRNNQSDPATLGEQVAYLQQCYQAGATAYEEEEAAKAEIDAINQRIYNQDPEIMPIWTKTRQWSVDAYKQFEERLGIFYDRWYFESETYGPGMDVVKQNIGTIFEEDAGAVVFRGENYGLHTRVFINSRGNPTYEAKDIGLAIAKWNEFRFSLSIYETGNDQSDYWRVEKQAIELVYPELKDKIATLHHGMINLTTGKMSSRTGNIVTAFSLVEMVKERAAAMLDESRGYNDDEKEDITEKVALAAIKYALLKSSASKDMTFDLETSVAHDGNSGPYLLYAYARTQSVLRKAADANAPRDITRDYVFNTEERAIALYLAQFNDTVTRAAIEYAPHSVATYLFTLAQAYSTFYNAHKIVADNPAETAMRLELTQKVAETLRQGLYLLGIDTVDRL